MIQIPKNWRKKNEKVSWPSIIDGYGLGLASCRISIKHYHIGKSEFWHDIQLPGHPRLRELCINSNRYWCGNRNTDMVLRTGPGLAKLRSIHLRDVRQHSRLEYHSNVQRPFGLFMLSGHDKPHCYKYHRVDGIDWRSGNLRFLQELSLNHDRNIAPPKLPFFLQLTN